MRRPPFAVALPVTPLRVPSRVSGQSGPAGAWLCDVHILADDRLEGRDTGTDRFAKAGAS